MSRKRKTLPKDFEETLVSGDLAAMKAVFDRCEFDAVGGYSKRTALGFAQCPDALARWLVEQGADIEARDTSGDTPLINRASHWQGDVSVLLHLGADVTATGKAGPALHGAARVHNLRAAEQLLQAGADPLIRDGQGLTPLGAALRHCSNAKLDTMASLASLLLEAGKDIASRNKASFLKRLTRRSPRSEADDPALKGMVSKLGETFEFYRADFNPESVDAADAGLAELYSLFNVPPAPRRSLLPMDKPIPVPEGAWPDRHEALWSLLVPGRGAAPSVQGEVIRISGRIADELERNGGINWDNSYSRMADAFAAHVASGNPLAPPRLEIARRAVAQVKSRRGDPTQLMELAVEWVAANPRPLPLPTSDYTR